MIRSSKADQSHVEMPLPLFEGQPRANSIPRLLWQKDVDTVLDRRATQRYVNWDGFSFNTYQHKLISVVTRLALLDGGMPT